MAFSMFLRTPVVTSRMLSQQIVRFASQPSLTRPTASRLLSKISLTEAKSTTPILNAVRLFRTSPVRLSATSDHTRLWVVERITSAILVPLIPIALLMPNKLFDSLVAIIITAHSFWGLETVVKEYVTVRIFGPVIPKFAVATILFIHLAQLGLCQALCTGEHVACNSAKISGTQFKYTRGLEAIAVDYARAKVLGPVLPKIAIGFVYLISIATLGGLLYIINHDIGISNTIRQLWAVKSGENNA